MEHPVYLQEKITRTCLLFDGMVRCGKMLVAPLVSDLPKIEYAQNIIAVNEIPTLWRLDSIEESAAVSLLRMVVDSCTYERAIGRHLNTRRDDIYAVHRSLNGEEILARVNEEEGRPALDRFNAAGRISSFITHQTLPQAELWFKAFPDLYLLLTVRHPIDVVYSWNSRGWGERWGNDPLGFSLAPEVNAKPVPWFALDFAEDYLSLSPWNRIVKCILSLLDVYDDALKGLNETQRGQVEIVCFERMAADPVAELERLAGWLGTTLHPDMETAMKRERVPRQLDINDRRDKLRQMEGEIEPELMDLLLAAGREYETRWGLEGL